ncbi:MAG: UDP-N-acetylmuramoyl-L-alanyl-D-glutamate--2,6-diaminopimelate ligase [Pseudomonadota bacterium]
MKLSDLIGRPVAGADPEIKGLTADSRAVRPGFLFAALAGVNADGARFIPQAEAAGAAAILAAPGVEASVPLVHDENPRRALALAAARFYGAQPETAVAVTGTNGKTSVARFVAQLWRACGRKAGSLGTIGAEAEGYARAQTHTTPEPVELHDILAEMAAAGTTHVALEASSHGLAQHRADGVRLTAAAFTNISQDHLDYHKDFDDYFAAKARLFTEVLPEAGTAVIDVDGAYGARMAEASRAAGRKVMTVGRDGEDIRLVDVAPTPSGLNVSLSAFGQEAKLGLPLVGAFQASNAAAALGLVVAAGEDAALALTALPQLRGVPGRMEFVGTAKSGGATYVDYAHTPDALATVLAAVRPHAAGRVHVVFGAGGDRDKTKRPLMGAAAAKGADVAILTDDNPRSEDAGAIRRAVREGCPQAIDIGDRRAAIFAAVDGLETGDVLIIAGKGHETGQTVGTETLPFDDAAVARDALAANGDDAGRNLGETA